jgi:hypothetical protein
VRYYSFFQRRFIIDPAIHNMKMQAINQIVVISGILVLLATASVEAATYIAQPAKAQVGSGANGTAGGVDRHLFCNTGVITPACK